MYQDDVEWNGETYSINVEDCEEPGTEKEGHRITDCALLHDHGWEDLDVDSDLSRSEKEQILAQYVEDQQGHF